VQSGDADGMNGDPWGWAGSVGEFLSTPLEVCLTSLMSHHQRLWAAAPAQSQRHAWVAELTSMAACFRSCVVALPSAADDWSVVFEFELPLEGGRRPDVVVLAGRSLVVLEFKSTAVAAQADVDQVTGYVRDLADYHAGSHHLDSLGVVVLQTAAPTFASSSGDIVVTSPSGLERYLMDAASPGTVPLADWLVSPYRPLPTLIEAARRIFRDEPLPHVHSALAAGIPETVELLGAIVDACAAKNRRAFALVTGVPGAGKTLVGLRLVYERSERTGRATFLSGNGPLVTVLQDALKSRVFVRDLHAYIKTYALNGRRRVPEENVVVFDEAQRAWDSRYMDEKKGVAFSEPELLIRIGERIDDWAVFVGLVGEGQEIHSGEEAGIAQWRDALSPPTANESWTVHCPPKLMPEFEGLDVMTSERLDLTVSLRSRRAEDLHQWVRLLLEGSLALAARQAARVHEAKYPIYLTRDLDEARRYVRRRFEGEPDKRTGLLASSHAKRLEAHGVPNSFIATSRMNVARWYNAPPDHPESSNALQRPVTEFGCQGLELDLPIVCWGEDYQWLNEAWRLTPVRRRYPQDDPIQLLRNAYRVLLTRGRDGMVIFVPPEARFDATEIALLAAGVRHIPDLIGQAVAQARSTFPTSRADHRPISS
jgi:hypothetical protein